MKKLSEVPQPYQQMLRGDEGYTDQVAPTE
jgi:hypothetical protein